MNLTHITLLLALPTYLTAHETNESYLTINNNQTITWSLPKNEHSQHLTTALTLTSQNSPCQTTLTTTHPEQRLTGPHVKHSYSYQCQTPLDQITLANTNLPHFTVWVEDTRSSTPNNHQHLTETKLTLTLD